MVLYSSSMGKLDRIQAYFINQNVEINFTEFAADILLTSLCAAILALVYIKFSKSLSNKRSFAGNFIVLALTTMMIISIIKSSIALSLGLVGALSIVRFRAAIKDPEELVYLFLAISLGLGFGAGHRYITLLFFFSICVVIVIKSLIKKPISDTGTFLSLANVSISFEELSNILKKHCDYVELNRLDVSKDASNAYFLIHSSSEKTMRELMSEVLQKDPDCKISFTQNKGLLN